MSGSWQGRALHGCATGLYPRSPMSLYQSLGVNFRLRTNIQNDSIGLGKQRQYFVGTGNVNRSQVDSSRRPILLGLLNRQKASGTRQQQSYTEGRLEQPHDHCSLVLFLECIPKDGLPFSELDAAIIMKLTTDGLEFWTDNRPDVVTWL